MSITEHIQTSRLKLHRSTEQHAEAIHTAYATDPEVTRYLSWKPHTDISQTVEFLDFTSQAWESGDEYTWSVFEQNGTHPIGMIGVQIRSYRSDCGYVLAKPYWGKGYMTEALICIRDMIFSMPTMERMQIVCDVDNPASARVMEKAGFQKEGVLRRYARHPNIGGKPRDCLCYSFVR